MSRSIPTLRRRHLPIVDIAPLKKQGQVGDVSFESKTNRRFRPLGFRDPLRKVPLVVSRMAAAAGTGHPLVFVDGADCRFGPLMKLVEKISLNMPPVSTTKDRKKRKRIRLDSPYQVFQAPCGEVVLLELASSSKDNPKSTANGNGVVTFVGIAYGFDGSLAKFLDECLNTVSD